MFEKEFELYLTRAKLMYKRSGDELFTETVPLNAEFAATKHQVRYADRTRLDYHPAAEGMRWGDPWDSGWFHLAGAVPKSWKGKPVALWLNLSGEALLFDAAGVPRCGLTNASVFDEGYCKDIHLLYPRAGGGEKVDLWVEAAANSIGGMNMDSDPGRHAPFPYGTYQAVARTMRIGLLNLDLWHFRIDVSVVVSLAETLGFNDYRAKRAVAALNQAAAVYLENPANAAAARKPLRKILDQPAASSAMTAFAVGHAHIDTGWLWPVRETVRKCARTFSSQIGLIERYPGYIFGASQAQHYAFTKEYYPELYRKIQEKVAEGTWEIQGGMWIEADCNLISGESMVRQFLHGKNFFRDEFGVEVRNLWIPDVFGYSASLPQIIRKSGCDYFLTQKISWSQFNRFPYHTFYWQGIDGTRVLTHFPPENTYNAALIPGEMIPAQNRLPEGDFQEEYLSLFGIGDGGGGPKEEHIERGLRLMDLDGNPRVRFSRADEFFETIAGKYGDQFPAWAGELYLELHRGTLTSQSRTKRNNRKLEQLLAAVEFAAASLPARQYPAKELDAIWKNLLLNQFHDIIPGSSIRLVYADTEREHGESLRAAAGLLAAAAAKLLREEEGALTVMNSLPCAWRGPVCFPESWSGYRILDAEGREIPAQQEESRPWALIEAPASSWSTFRRGKKRAGSARLKASGAELVLENDLVRYEFAADGRLLRAFDREAGREILSGAGNVLSFYNDHPNNWEAWDIDVFYQDEYIGAPRAVKAVRRSDGPVRQVLEFELAVGESRIQQQVALAAGSKRLDFNTTVQWHEVRKMLRVSFPAKVFADEVACDIQYGYVKRANHTNTTWDFAKFEVAAQRYVDLSERDYGVALLNDCKYGHKLRGSTLDLCLLRSPKFPDWDADQGEHRFTYSLFPHRGDLVAGQVYDEAARLNRLPAVFDGLAGAVAVPCRVESDTVRMEVLKKAEKSGDLVVRLVETAGCPAAGTLVLNGNYKVTLTDLIEWTDEGTLPVKGGRAEFQLKPFELVTLKLSKVR